MQPGDIYNSPNRQQPPYPPPFQSQSPSSSRPQMSQTQPPSNAYNSYDSPYGVVGQYASQPQSPPHGMVHHSQSHPFPRGGGRGGYGGQSGPGDGANGDPFNDQIPPDAYAGSRHYPSQPNMASMSQSPPMRSAPFGSGPTSPRHSFPSAQPSQQFATPPAPSGPQARFDSNANMSSPHMNSGSPHMNSGSPHLNSGSPHVGFQAPQADYSAPRPIPLMHQSSSSVGIGQVYPPQSQNNLSGQGGYGRQDEDINDSAPLLSHATPDSRFGISQSQSNLSFGGGGGGGGYQLSDVGTPSRVAGDGSDLGMIPGAWNGNGNGGPHYDDGDNVHYGPVPARIIRRNRTQKRVA